MAPWHLYYVFTLCALALLLAVASTARAEPLRLAALTPGGVTNGSVDSQRELECLALNVYWEARSEPRIGQFAVAAVVLNRVADAEFRTPSATSSCRAASAAATAASSRGIVTGAATSRATRRPGRKP